jgi:hypothetical protein
MEVLYRGGQSEGFDTLYVLMCASRVEYVASVVCGPCDVEGADWV